MALLTILQPELFLTRVRALQGCVVGQQTLKYLCCWQREHSSETMYLLGPRKISYFSLQKLAIIAHDFP